MRLPALPVVPIYLNHSSSFSMPAMSPTTSPLLTLPLELRIAIYSHLLTARTQPVLLYHSQPDKPHQAYHSTTPFFWSASKSTTRLLRSSTTPTPTKSNCASTGGVIHASFRPFPPKIRRNVSADLMLSIAWTTSKWKFSTPLSAATKMQRPPSTPLESYCLRCCARWAAGSARGRGWNRVISEERKGRGSFWATSMKPTLLVSFARCCRILVIEEG